MRNISSKNIPYIATLVIIGIALIYSLISMRSAINSKNNSSGALKNKTAEYQNILKKSETPPNRSSLLKVASNLDELRERYNYLSKLLPQKKENEEVPVPLEFKENLLKLQRLLIERAKLYKISIPKPLGFVEYEGGIIPQTNKISVLTEQMDVIQTLVSYLIECRIQSLDSIKRLEPLRENQKAGLFRTLPFELNITCSMKALVSFLAKLSSSKTFFIVKDVNIQQKSDTGLSVKINLEVLLFKL